MTSNKSSGRAVVSLATIAMVLCGLQSTARADLLLYEPFDYPVGELLDGQTPPDGMGMTGSWTAWDHQDFGMKMADGPRDPFQYRSWDGVAHNVAQTGNFISLGFDGRAHVRGMVTMDSSVTAMFTSESVTWMSVVAAQGDVPWGFWPMLAVGARELTEQDRGNKAEDQAIGGGGYFSDGQNGPVGAHYWDDEDANGTFEIHPSATNARFSYPAELIVLKITWDDPSEDGKDKVQAFQFDVGKEDALVPTEEAFDLDAVTNSADLDQSLFDTLSYAGGRIELDEIRIGTTFDDVVTGTEVGSSTVELAWQSDTAADWTSASWSADGGATSIAPIGGEDMTVDLAAGPVNVTTDLSATPAASLSIAATGSGTVNVATAGTLAVTGNVAVGPFGTLTVDGILTAEAGSVGGTLAGNGTINVDPIVVTGTVAPGGDGAAGALTVAVASELAFGPGATYDAEVILADLSSLAADKIVNTKVQSEGTIDVSDAALAPQGIGRTDSASFTPTTTLKVVDNAATGQFYGPFGTVTPAAGPGASAHIGQGAFLRKVTYEVGVPTPAVNIDVVALEGDTDGDGLIGLDDWDAFRANFGSSAADWTEGNFDPWSDDMVDLDDWDIFRNRFGQTYPIDVAASAAAAVPEPSTIVMLLGALAGLAVLGRRRRR